MVSCVQIHPAIVCFFLRGLGDLPPPQLHSCDLCTVVAATTAWCFPWWALPSVLGYGCLPWSALPHSSGLFMPSRVCNPQSCLHNCSDVTKSERPSLLPQCVSFLCRTFCCGTSCLCVEVDTLFGKGCTKVNVQDKGTMVIMRVRRWSIQPGETLLQTSPGQRLSHRISWSMPLEPPLTVS